MRLTSRGRATVLIVGVTVLLAWQFGARSLNAVAAPLVVALAVGVIHLYWAEPPHLELSDLAPGFPGQERPLSLSIEGSGLVTVVLPETDGLVTGTLDATVTAPYTVERTVELDRRGVYDIVPETVRQQGPLGLVVREVPAETAATLVVYPPRYALSRENVLVRRFDRHLTTERQEFDHLREYTAGDPLRNVHWKSSAKRDEFMVMEFTAPRGDETVTIVATAAPECADEMASTAATVVDVALDSGLSVGLIVPDGTVGAGHGEDHRRELLTALARTGSGRFTDSVVADADIHIDTGYDGTELTVGDEQFTLAQVRGDTTRAEVVKT